MVKEVNLRISNQQQITGVSPEEDRLTYEGRGNLYIKDNHYYLVYRDHSPGLEGVRTTIKIDQLDQRVHLLRGEPVQMEQTFEPGEVKEGRYGEITLAAETERLILNIDDNQGLVQIRYSLYLNGHHTSKNNLQIKWDGVEK